MRSLSVLLLFCFFAFAHAGPLPTEAQAEKERKAVLYAAHSDSPPSADLFLRRHDRSFIELNVDSLIKAIDRTKTTPGSVEFENLLKPTANISELKDRRIVLEFLLQNEGIFVKLDQLVSEFRELHEDLFLHFLDKNSRLQFLDNSPLALQDNASSLYQLGLQGFTTLFIAQGLVYEGLQAYRNFGDMRNAQNRGWFRGFVGYNLLGQIGGIAVATYFTSKTLVQTMQRITAADEYVLRFARAQAHIETIQNLVSGANPLQKLSFSSLSEDPAFINIRAAANSRLSNEKSFLSSIWSLNSLSVYDELCISTPIFSRLLKSVGVIDAYLSVIRLHKEYEALGLDVTLASFDTEHEMGFSFEGLRNPIVPNSVPNDFALAFDSSARHAVLTGPHGCGKTTIMKSIAYGFILGQSILLVPAKKAQLSPITNIHTYFNIGDNLPEGLSSFMAEHKRMAELKHIGTTLPATARALILIDEPYAKTIQAIGEPRVTSFLRSVSEFSNLSVLLATHFEEPSHLEALTNGRFKNFQPEVDESLKPTYKIISGSADWWFNNSSRREAFIAQLMTTLSLD